MKPVKWGVISTAKIGRNLVLPAMAKSPHIKLTAIASRDKAKAIRDGAAAVVPLENSIANMRVIDALFESEKTGGWVTP